MNREELDRTAAEDSDRLLGRVLAGKYRVDALLGRGGMGSVYRATQLDLVRPVAVKVVLPSLASRGTTLERFKREALAVARMRHPNIVTIFDFGVDEGAGAFLVLELLDGVSLRTRLERGGPLPLDLALDVASAVCSAVGSAHRAGVLHRDLKPDNIFLEEISGSVRAKILDFGIAKLADDAFDITSPGAPIGTPVYMAPEQFLGGRIDERADVYSLGCVCYEMLAGAPPFVASTAMAMAYKHAQEPAPSPARVRPDVPPHVEAAVLRALAKRPEDRFDSPDALAAALRGGDAVTPSAADTIVGETPAPAPTVPDNLPAALTSFVGRERELEELSARLAEARLVTVLGPGGMGKTRLSLEAAARVRLAFADGVWFVELAPIADPALVPAAVAAALEVGEEPGRPLLETVAEVIRAKRLLLVLDNCEHLVDAAAAVARAVLSGGGGVRVLATSREALGLPGELVWPLAPLRDWESVRLFVERARLSHPDFEVTEASAANIALLCARLEAMPLAIELAAARARVLSVEQILERMDDRLRLLAGSARGVEARQRTLRGAIDWSYALLTDDERLLFARLSAFAGGWTLEAAEAVCAGGAIDELAVLDLLARLVDKSLVVAEEGGARSRFRMLESIREYARERLAVTDGAGDTHRRHHAWCLGLARAHVEGRFLPTGRERVAALALEIDNLRAALGWSIRDARDAALGGELVVALFRFWIVQGLFGEGERWILEALALGDGAPAALRAGTLFALSAMRLNLGDFVGAAEAADASIARYRDLGDAKGLVGALTNRGVASGCLGEYDVGAECLSESVALCRRHGFDRELTRGLRGFAELAYSRGDLEGARASFAEYADRCRAGDFPFDAPAGFNSYGETLRMLGDLDGAARRLDECLEMIETTRYHAIRPNVMVNYGKVLRDRGEYGRARACFVEAADAFRATGNRGDMVEVLAALAVEASRRGAAARAFVLAGAVDAATRTPGVVLYAVALEEIEAGLARVRGALPPEDAARARERGRAMTIPEALDWALTAET